MVILAHCWHVSPQAVTNVPSARYSSSAVFYSGKMWLIGGFGIRADGSGMCRRNASLRSLAFTAVQEAAF
jgi:hypothetical protein